jgi:hypothetical protein
MGRKLEGNIDKTTGGGEVHISGRCEGNGSIGVLSTVLA